ncbi:MAG: class I SAM-dependent methyltransferase [Anaerolineae bacterium]|nr:class I SAM-dependent methyltransferase [Anaerolineae bacterium]
MFKSSVLEKDKQEELEEVYNSEKYWGNPQRRAETVNYDLHHKRVRIYRRILQKLADLIPQRGCLLDVGCAKGVFLDVARREGWQPIGLEISSFASQYARDNFGLEVFIGTLGEAPWPDASFDVITMLDVIEHLIDPSSVLLQARRLLKAGGILVIETPNARSILHYAAKLIYTLSMTSVKWPVFQIYGVGPEGHVIFFDQNTLIYLLNKNGFEFLYSDFDAMGQALWRSATLVERLAGTIDNVGSILFGGKYHMLVFAQSGERSSNLQLGD